MTFSLSTLCASTVVHSSLSGAHSSLSGAVAEAGLPVFGAVGTSLWLLSAGFIALRLASFSVRRARLYRRAQGRLLSSYGLSLTRGLKQHPSTGGLPSVARRVGVCR